MAEDGLLIASLVAQLKLDIADFEQKATQVDRALSPVQRVLDSVTRGASSLTSGITGTIGRMTNLIGIVAGVQLGLGGLERVLAGGREAIIGYNSTLEQAQLSFTYLTGSADTAREHIQWLLDQADRSPFPHEQWLQASRSLQTLGVNLTHIPGLLDKVADAAAGVHVPFDVATQAIGRFLTLTAGGQGGGYATRQLMSLGLITGPLRNELTQMEAAGAAPQAVIDRFLASLARFRGAALEAANTWEGLMARIKSSVEETAGVAFRPLFEALTEMARRLKDALDTESFRLAMQRFAMFVLDAVQAIGEGIFSLGETVTGVWTRWGAQFQNAITAWNALPAWLKDVGILGAVLGGIKGAVAIGAMLSLFQTARNSIAALKEGMPVSEWATSNAEQVRAWLEARGKVPGEGAGPMVDTSLGAAAGMVQGSTMRDQFNDSLNRARRNLEAQMQGLTAPPPKAPPPPTGPMMGPPPPATVAQQLKLEEARRAFLELNPLLTDSEKQASALALRFEQLEKDAGPVAGSIRQLGQAAQIMIREWADAAANKQLENLPFKEGTTDVQQWEEAVAIATTQVNRLTADLGPNADRVKEWRDYLYAATDQLQAVRRAQEAVTEALERNAAAARDDQLISEALWKTRRDMEEEQRQAAVTRAAAEAQAGTLRKAGVEVNLTGDLQQQVTSRLQFYQQQIAQLNQRLGETEPQSEQWRRLADDIDFARSRVGELAVELQRLQGLNTLKSLVTDVFGAMSRAVSTSISGVIQGTTTMKEAFNNMGRSILLSIEEMIINRAFKEMEKAFNAMIDSMIKTAQDAKIVQLILQALGIGVGAAATQGGKGGGLPPVGTQVGSGYNPSWAAGSGAGAKGAIVRKPTSALIGEAGPEALIPLDQMPGASPLPEMGGGEQQSAADMTRLFAMLAGSIAQAGAEVTIIDQRSGGEIERREATGQDGRKKIELLIKDVVKGSYVGGEMDRLMAALYGLTRQGASR